MSEPATWTLSGTGATDWLDTMMNAFDFGAHGVWNGALTVVFEVSCDEVQSTTKPDAKTIETLSADFAKQWAQPLPRFVRFRATSGGGSAIISIWPGQAANKERFVIAPQQVGGVPPSSEA